MARSVWSGSLSFGLVNVPVLLYSGTSQKSVRFNQISKATGARIRQKRVDPTTDQEVPYEEIMKGYEISPDRYVMIDPEELEALAPKKTKMIELEDFVPLAAIDPMCFDQSYHMLPNKGAGKAYKLLVKVLEEANVVGIGRFVLRTRESLAAVRSKDGRLWISTLVWADEITDVKFEEEKDAPEASQAEHDMALKLIGALSRDFDHSRYEDEYRSQVLALIESKAAGETFAMPESTEAIPAPDLMSALSASLESAGGEKVPAKKSPAKRTAKKSPAKKAA